MAQLWATYLYLFMNAQHPNKPIEPQIELWHRLLRRLSIIRAWNTWIAWIATGGCVGVFFSYSQGWWIVLLMVAVLAWQLASSADSQIKMLESFRARHGLRSEPKTPVA